MASNKWKNESKVLKHLTGTKEECNVVPVSATVKLLMHIPSVLDGMSSRNRLIVYEKLANAHK